MLTGSSHKMFCLILTYADLQNVTFRKAELDMLDPVLSSLTFYSPFPPEQESWMILPSPIFSSMRPLLLNEIKLFKVWFQVPKSTLVSEALDIQA